MSQNITSPIDLKKFSYNGRQKGVRYERKEFRRSLAIFPIGSVMKLTDLTARQIRYYEDQGLIKPDRNEGIVACIL